MPDPGEVLTRNWLHFGQILRGLGFDAGPARMLPFLAALTVIDLGNPDDLRTAVRVHFARRRDELIILDRALAAFLLANAPAGEAPAPSPTASHERGAITSTARQLEVLAEDGATVGAAGHQVASCSQAEELCHKHFAP